MEISEAARACSPDPKIRASNGGYDTMLDVGSGVLSTGQRQLLTTARAFLMRSVVLILGEATSSVDTRTELLVQHALDKLRQGLVTAATQTVSSDFVISICVGLAQD